MPQMDGWETTGRIRFNMSDPMRAVPIVALTAYATVDAADRCLREGMDDFISFCILSCVCVCVCACFFRSVDITYSD